MRPRLPYPRFEYSNRVPGAQTKVTPPCRSSAKRSKSSPCCRSPNGSSVGNPADIVSKCSIVIGGESTVGPLDPGQLRDPLHPVVESQPALVAKEQDGCRGEALRHRRDTEDAVLVGSQFRPVPERADPAGMSEPAIDDDPIGDPGRHAARGQPLEDRVDFGQGLRQGHPGTIASPPAPPQPGSIVDPRSISGRWQRVECAGARHVTPGSSCAHRSMACGQRGWKRQPDGGSNGSGNRPRIALPPSPPTGATPGTSIDARRAAVYGWAGSGMRRPRGHPRRSCPGT